jgi:hypothetical protein
MQLEGDHLLRASGSSTARFQWRASAVLVHHANDLVRPFIFCHGPQHFCAYGVPDQSLLRWHEQESAIGLAKKQRV